MSDVVVVVVVVVVVEYVEELSYAVCSNRRTEPVER